MKWLYYILLLIASLLLSLIPYSLAVRLLHDNLPTYLPYVVELGTIYIIIIMISGLLFWWASNVKKNMQHRKKEKEFETFLSEKN